MMKKLLYMALAVFTFAACSDDLTDLNVNIKDPAIVPAGSLVANATEAMFEYMASPSVNRNTFRLWSQQWAQTTYPDESNYELVPRDINGFAWTRLYSTILRDLADAKKFVDASTTLTDELKTNQSAIITINEVLAYSILVDLFGDVPYSEALDGENITPSYDNDTDVYNDLILKLDAAIENLGGETGLADYDLVYGGDATAWKKFGNTLKLRMAIRIADLNSTKAADMVSQAITSGIFESSADNFQLAFQASPPYTNPLWDQLVQSGRSDFIAANTLTDYMNDLGDPRIPYFFKNNAVDGSAVGGVYGSPNNYAGNSQPSELLENPEMPGVIMDMTEVYFLLADAKERGYNVGATTAKEYYSMGVTESILSWGGSTADATAYLANADVDYDTAPGSWKERIAMQKWLALYNRGYEAWNTYRMYDAPVMNVATAAGTTPPMRYTYPSSEYPLNGASVEAAASAIGGDNLMTKVFWDVN